MTNRLTSKDIEGLPDDVLSELTISAKNEFDMMLIDIIAARGGQATLNEIIVDAYREHGKKLKRTETNAKIFRAITSGVVRRVAGRKGLYELTLSSQLPEMERTND